MPFVEIKMWKGRSDDQKKKMIRKVTAAISESLDLDKKFIQVAISEFEPADWGIAGTPGDEL